MKSAVLYHKQGTLAEPRFKNLSDLQWLYHYVEINSFNQKEDDSRLELTKTLVEVFRNEMKFAAYLIAPENAGRWEEAKKLNVAREEIPEEDAQAFWDDLKTKIPAKLICVNPNAGPKYILPKAKMTKLGITIK